MGTYRLILVFNYFDANSKCCKFNMKRKKNSN